jgi:hypothetical protein
MGGEYVKGEEKRADRGNCGIWGIYGLRWEGMYICR